jgi:hypothetical protein
MAQPMPKLISRQQGNETHSAQAEKAVFSAILSADMVWKSVAAYPPSLRCRTVPVCGPPKSRRRSTARACALHPPDQRSIFAFCSL